MMELSETVLSTLFKLIKIKKEYQVKLSEGDIEYLRLLLYFKIDQCKSSLKENLYAEDRKTINESFEDAVTIKTKLQLALLTKY